MHLKSPSQKSLLIFTPFFEPHAGGLESFVDELSTHLASPNFHITIFTSAIPQNPEPKPKNSHITIIRFPAFELVHNFPVPKFWTSEFQQAWSRLRAQSFDFQMTQTRFFLTSLFPFWFGRELTSWIHVEHGSSFTKQSPLISFCAWLFDLTFGRRVLQKADSVVAISQGVKDFVNDLAPKATSVQVIHRGLDFIDLPSQRDKNQVPVITFVGRLIHGKGVQDLISALAHAQSQGWKFSVNIIGAGSFSSKLKEMAAAHKLDSIHFLGQKSKPEVFEILSQTDIFVNPSFSEGLPTSVLEAGFSGCAVIATDVGGTSEIISDKQHGILIPPHSSQILSEQIIFLLQNSLQRVQMGKNLKAFVAKNFSWEQVISEFQQLFI